MRKDFKKQQQRLKKLAKNLDQSRGSIPALVTNMPDGLREHYGEGKFKIIFEYYNHNQCELTALSSNDMKRVINTFNKVTKHDQTTIKKLFRPSPIKKGGSGNYANLFNGLPPDFDILHEIDYKGSGRIFVHLSGLMCCVVAVGSQHR